MEFGLKGVTDYSLLKKTKDLKISSIGFDFRPKSFNFTQKKNALALCKQSSKQKIKLLFSLNPEFIFEEFWREFSPLTEHLIFELYDQVDLEGFEKNKMPYSFVLDDFSQIKLLKHKNYLNNILLSSKFIDEVLSQNEVFGLGQILQTIPVDVGLQCKWDMDIPQGIFDILNIQFLDFEMSSEVELSYQKANLDLIENVFIYLKTYFEKKGKELSESTFIE